MEISGRTSTEQIKTINDVSLDIYELAKSVRSELEILHPLSDDCCIYRVPKLLRQLNEKTYTPRAVSVRPLHHGKPELRPMEGHKTRYNDFLEWSEKKENSSCSNGDACPWSIEIILFQGCLPLVQRVFAIFV